MSVATPSDVNELLGTAALVSLVGISLSDKTDVWFGVFVFSVGALLYRLN